MSDISCGGERQNPDIEAVELVLRDEFHFFVSLPRLVIGANNKRKAISSCEYRKESTADEEQYKDDADLLHSDKMKVNPTHRARS